MNVKYIVFEDNALGAETIVVFPGNIQHQQMGMVPGRKISAGFVHTESMSCFGKSVSLDLKSRPEEDTKLLREMFPHSVLPKGRAAYGPQPQKLPV
jgi:hypothetical protein